MGKYLWSSVTATGVILGLGSRLNVNSGSESLNTLCCLSPLIIIIPCWLIFFDKATTITRIVGYSRWLEYMSISGSGRDKYIGWENALLSFREQSEDKHVLSRMGKYIKNMCSAIPAMLKFKASHRYWTLNWITFFLLSALCLVLAFKGCCHNRSTKLFLFEFILPLFCFLLGHNLYMISNLFDGKYSYKENSKKWNVVMQGVNAKEFFLKHFETEQNVS